MEMVDSVRNLIAGVKVGHQMDYAEGNASASKVIKGTWSNLKLFLDIKGFDTLDTMAKSVGALSTMHHADIFNVAAAIGPRAMRAVVENRGDAEVYAVTVPTSMDEDECFAVYNKVISHAVADLAILASRAGVQGIICSAQQLTSLRRKDELAGLDFMTPGVRSPGAETHDQKQVETPADAVAHGAKYIVIGREATQAKDPVAAVQRIRKDIGLTA